MNPNANLIRSNKEIFLAALKIADQKERQEFLDRACGSDSKRRREVEELLAADDAGNAGPLDQAIEQLGPADTIASSAEASPALDISSHPTIGPYKLRERLGEGGMGEVFVAEQRKPVARTVALKLIKRGMDTKEVLARFEAERQALAMMNHPNIASVLDIGQTDDGRPYFVMDMVRGYPITKYCEQHKLNLRERLELVVTVCRAIQHAHQKGVIHRDLKPGNVLVELDDVRHIPKVIDFGVAKATNQRLTEHSLYTQNNQMIGTPLYMSPEQAQLTSQDVDTRSDVYSLGVLLYELLTGRTPFDKETLTKAGYDEMRRIIREDEPPRPSHRISTLGAEQRSTHCERSGEDPEQIERQVRGELDWIVMKSLEKDRVRRYQSPSDLGADVQRYLDGDLVQACPPSVGYRLRKTARRYSVLLSTTALILISLFAGAAIAIWQAQVAVAERAHAEESEKNARQEAAIAKAVTEFLQQDLLGKSHPDETPDPEVKLRTVLERAAASVEAKFQGQPVVEAAIRDTIGQAFRALGEYRKAETHQVQAFELAKRERGARAPATLVYSAHLGQLFNDLGRHKAAEKILRETFESQQQVLGTDHHDTLISKLLLGKTMRLLGQYDEAESLTRQASEICRRKLGAEHADTLRSMNALANIYLKQGLYDKAKDLHLQTLEAAQRALGEEHPNTLHIMNNLTVVDRLKGHYAEAEALGLKTLELRKRTLGVEHPSTLSSMMTLASVYSQQERLHEAEKLGLRTLELFKQKLGKEHRRTLICMNNLAAVRFKQGRVDEAHSSFREVFEIRRRTLGEEHPDTLSSMENVAIDRRDIDESDALRREVFDILKRTLGEDHPQTLGSLYNLAISNRDMERYGEAERLFLSVIERRRRTLGQDHPDTIMGVTNLGVTYRRWCWELANNPVLEERDPAKAVEVGLKLIDLEYEHDSEATRWNKLGVAYFRNGEFDKAVKTMLKADQLGDGEDREHRPFLAMSQWQLGDKASATRHCNQYIAWFLSKNRNSDAERVLSEMESLLGLVAEDRQKHADEYFQLELESLTRALEENLNDVNLLTKRAEVYGSQKHWAKQAADLEIVAGQRPEDFDALSDLAAAYWQMKQPEPLLANGQALVRLNPQHTRGYNRTAQAYDLRNDYESALANYSRAIEISPRARWLYKSRCRVLANLSRWEEALTDIQQHNEITKTDGQGWMWEALLLHQLNDEEGYQSLCGRMLTQYREDPSREFAAWTLGVCGYHTLPSEERNEAVEIGQEWLDELSEDDQMQCRLGTLYYRQGEYSQAIKHFESAIQINDNDVGNQVWMAMGQYKFGNVSEAARWLQRARDQHQQAEPVFDEQWRVLLELPMLFDEAATLIEAKPNAA